MNTTAKWYVWVGGICNEHETIDTAIEDVREWREDGYDDVIMEQVRPHIYVPTEGDYVTVEPSRLGQFPGVWQVFEAQNRYDGMRATLVQPGWDTDLGSLTVPAYLLTQYTGWCYR